MADYFESGFCVRERSWHGKELLLAEAPKTWDEARMAAGLMWEPRLAATYRKVTTTRPATPEEVAADPEQTVVQWDRSISDWVIRVEEFAVVEEAKVVERDDTNAVLGTVSGTFELITHAEMGTILEPLLEQTGVEFDTAGSVRGGAQVFATLLLDEPYQIKGDVDAFGDPVLSLPYFALLNSHNGTGACKGLYTQVRVVCANTYQAADMDGDRHGAQFSLRHTAGVKDRISEARNVVENCRAEAARWRAVAEQLALIRVTPEQQVQFLSEFIPEPPAGIVSDRVRENIANDRAKFMHVLNDSATNSAMAHTGLGLVNAAVEYLDHVRGFRNRETYMGRQILTTEPLKAKAVRLVRELCPA